MIFPSLSKATLLNHSFFWQKLDPKYLNIQFLIFFPENDCLTASSSTRLMKFDLWWDGSSSLWSNSSARRFSESPWLLERPVLVGVDDLGKKNAGFYRVVLVYTATISGQIKATSAEVTPGIIDSMALVCKVLILHLSEESFKNKDPNLG